MQLVWHALNEPGRLERFFASPVRLDLLRSWGVTRLSMGWRDDCRRHVRRLVADWGEEMNIYGVPDLESFLQAALLLPRSLTSDFTGLVPGTGDQVID